MRVRPLAVSVFSLLIGALLSQAEAAPSAPDVLSSPGVKSLRRVGVLVVGAEAGPAAAARARVGAALQAAGRAVVPLPLSPGPASRLMLLRYSAKHELDAVAIVRISTASSGWTVSADILDPVGAPVIAWVRRRAAGDVSGAGGAGIELIAARFSFPLAEGEVAAAQPAEDDPPETSDAGTAARPRLLVTDGAVLYGGALIDGASFYNLVGRPYLEAQYKHNAAAIATTRTIGYISLGIGVTALALVAFAAGFTQGACLGPNAVSSVSDRPASCGSDSSSLLLVPVALGVAGGALLATSAAMPRDPLSLEERRELARGYNAR